MPHTDSTARASSRGSSSSGSGSDQHPVGYLSLSPPQSPMRDTTAHSHRLSNSGDSSTLPRSVDGGPVQPIFSERKAVHTMTKRRPLDLDDYFVSAISLSLSTVSPRG
jgi:hypothetical protein